MKRARKKEHVLAIDLGTFCDNKLMESALREVKRKYKVVYLTDEGHKLKDTAYIKEGFTTPDFFTQDPHTRVANSSKGFWSWMVTHPGDTYRAYKWAMQIREKINAVIAKYEPKCILILYPALSVVWLFEQPPEIPIYVLYYAPGIVSRDIPWLFDSRLRDPDFRLYKPSKENVESGVEYLCRISSHSFRSADTEEVFRSLHHVFCWDDALVPQLKLGYRGLHIHKAGALLSDGTQKKVVRAGNPVLRDLVAKNKNIVFVSFGSYGGSDLLKPQLERLLHALHEFCIAHDHAVVFHNGSGLIPPELTTAIHAVDGYVPYEYIVPKSKLVIFTGSVCLQNISFFYGVPMVFFPVLIEQFYWAKNYEHHTGVPYIDYQAAALPEPFNTFLRKAMKRNKFLGTVSRHLRKGKSAAENILDLIN